MSICLIQADGHNSQLRDIVLELRLRQWSHRSEVIFFYCDVEGE